MAAFNIGDRIRPTVSPDAVVVVPGIMGSTLESDRSVLWGAHRLGWYLKSWTAKFSALDELILSDDERGGRYGRIRATGLLRFPAWAPFLAGLEPYGDLLTGIRRVVVHADAILEFPYDWRLSVAYNAQQLERAARAHLDTWLHHAEYSRFLRELPDTRPAQLVIIAHSMGGLLARALPDDLNVRATVTLGTPFNGSAKAAIILNHGSGTPFPLPRGKLRRLAHSMPGLHDLLPTYRCLDDRAQDSDPTRLTPSNVEAIGGDSALAEQSFAWHDATKSRSLPGHQALIGVRQPTVSTLVLKDGVLEGQPYTFETTRNGLARDAQGVLVRTTKHGDGTVPDNSARPADLRPVTLAQQHGPIAKSPETIAMVQAVLCERDPHAPDLGNGGIGIELPDLVKAGTEVTVIVTGVGGPASARVTVRDEDNNVPATNGHPKIHYRDGAYRASLGPLSPGIYEVEVSGRDASPVSQRFLVDPT